jgi:hypothetical protein
MDGWLNQTFWCGRFSAMESLARVVVITLVMFLLLGLSGLMLAIRGRGSVVVSTVALTFSLLQVIVGLTALVSLRPLLLTALVSPGLCGILISVRALLRARH